MFIRALVGTEACLLGGKAAEGRNQSSLTTADVLNASYALPAWCLHTEATLSVKEHNAKSVKLLAGA